MEVFPAPCSPEERPPFTFGEVSSQNWGTPFYPPKYSHPVYGTPEDVCACSDFSGRATDPSPSSLGA